MLPWLQGNPEEPEGAELPPGAGLGGQGQLQEAEGGEGDHGGGKGDLRAGTAGGALEGLGIALEQGQAVGGGRGEEVGEGHEAVRPGNMGGLPALPCRLELTGPSTPAHPRPPDPTRTQRR